MRIVFTMPVYNEEEGITDFCEEILEIFKEYKTEIIVVNDFSSDSSENVIRENLIKKYGSVVTLVNNPKNLGHGPSTIIGIRKALLISSTDIIVTVDGDGQFKARDILYLVQEHKKLNMDVTEGVRINRTDPMFRKVSTSVCKFLVFSLSGKFPNDGNTCLRVYTPKSLEKLINRIPSDFLIPNVLISTYTRIEELNFTQIKIDSIQRRGRNSIGSTWKQRFLNIPSRRYLVFCFRATIQWILAIFRNKEVV